MQNIKMKYKIKTCDSEERARDLKEKVDTYVKRQGGQTTLDEEG